MTAKAKRRSAPKQSPTCQCQEQIKDILTRLELLEADKSKIVCEIKPASAERLRDTYEQMADVMAKSMRGSMRVILSPPNPARERLVAKMRRELIAHDVAREIARSLPPKKKRGATNNPQKKSQ